MTTDDRTDAKTLWTETILETLYEGLEKGRGDEWLRDMLGEVRNTGYRSDVIINKVEKKVGREAAERVRVLLAG